MEAQSKAILKHLQEGNSLTPIDALNMFGCFRLGARIFDLKQAGYNIVTEMISENKKRFARYYLEISL